MFTQLFTQAALSVVAIVLVAKLIELAVRRLWKDEQH